MMIPQAPLFEKRLLITVLLRPPEIDTPVPVGPAAALPAAGTLGLLLSWTLLCLNTQQEWVFVIGLVPFFGHAPSCGDGESSLFWLLVSNPSLLWSNCEFSMTRLPPEFVPE